jgi:hypothetical protein
VAQAGNIGTNHLFEPILLDRLIAFGLGWLALGLAVGSARVGLRWSPWIVGVATLVHPAVGIQLGLLLVGFWSVWLLVGWARITEDSGWFDLRSTLLAIGCVGLALIPGVWLNLGESRQLLEGLPTEDFRLLSVELQGPQHMLPHLWRRPQWLAWGCYPLLAALALMTTNNRTHEARRRLVVLLAVNLAGLGLAWYGIERLHHLRLTLFQPFRMATIARGLCLVIIARHWNALWQSGSVTNRIRAAMLAVGLTGDWALVLVTAFESVCMTMEWIPGRKWLPFSLKKGGQRGVWAVPGCGLQPQLAPPYPAFAWAGTASAQSVREVYATLVRMFVNSVGWLLDRARLSVGVSRSRIAFLAGAPVLAYGLYFLSKHDTESGHIPLLLALITTPIVSRILDRRPWEWTLSRLVRLTVYAWVVPALALLANLVPEGSTLAHSSVRSHLVRLCRFGAVPLDDAERLGLWCRTHLPAKARLVGPPGPKTIRLWSERSLAFNRAGSPYNARGLADWSRRFADHVRFDGPPSALVRAYLADRHGFEARYDALDLPARAALARRQAAEYVIGPVGQSEEPLAGLKRIHQEGRYVLYRRTDLLPTLLTRSSR